MHVILKTTSSQNGLCTLHLAQQHATCSSASLVCLTRWQRQLLPQDRHRLRFSVDITHTPPSCACTSYLILFTSDILSFNFTLSSAKMWAVHKHERVVAFTASSFRFVVVKQRITVGGLRFRVVH